jgi:hypothetical protein
VIDPNCPACHGEGWMCEEHQGEPFGHPLTSGKNCFAPGDKCLCNPTAELCLNPTIFASNDARDFIAAARPPRE